VLVWCLAQVTVAFNKDPSPVKVNLGVGAYRTEVRGAWGCGLNLLWPPSVVWIGDGFDAPLRVLIRAGREAPRAECGPVRRADAYQ